eukprot:COSAG05_NODE_1901_length_3856_cov_3.807559_4_plen_108_part_00
MYFLHKLEICRLKFHLKISQARDPYQSLPVHYTCVARRIWSLELPAAAGLFWAKLWCSSSRPRKRGDHKLKMTIVASGTMVFFVFGAIAAGILWMVFSVPSKKNDRR